MIHNFIRTPQEWREIAQEITAGPLPHASKDDIYISGQAAARILVDFIGGVDGLKIAEIGAGNGRNAMGLTEYPLLEYTGVEIIEPCVGFCQSAFSPWQNFTFRHADVYNRRYNGGSSIMPQDARYPLEDGRYDLVLLMSVLTHEPNRSAVRNILSEARRALVPGGRLLVTWFKSPPDKPSDDHAKVVFPESEILEFTRGWIWIKDGYPDNIQWYTLLRS